MKGPILAIEKQEYVWIRHFVLGPFEGDNLTKEFIFHYLQEYFSLLEENIFICGF